MGGADRELQRVSAADWLQRAGDRVEPGWFGGQLLHVALDRVVAGFEEAGGLPHAPGVRPAGALHRIVAGRPASAEAHDDVLPQAGRRAGYRVSGAVRRGTKQETEIDQALFPNPYNLTPPVWWKDSRGFTFEYNQRGHQVYRVIEVDAQTGKARALIDETAKTLHLLQRAGPGLSGGRRYRHDVNDGKEIIWASERDGWEHLYLYDGVDGQGEEPDHQGRLAGAQCRSRGRRQAPDLVSRRAA